MCTFPLRSLSRIFTAIFLTCITYFTCSLSSSVTDMHSMMSMRSRLGLGDKYLLTKDHFKDFKGKLLVFSCFSQGIFFGALHLSFQTLLLRRLCRPSLRPPAGRPRLSFRTALGPVTDLAIHKLQDFSVAHHFNIVLNPPRIGHRRPQSVDLLLSLPRP